MNLEWENIETPERLFESGKFGKTMPMWEVQTMGYEKGSVLSPGLVSRGAGFLDSPDAEFISEGNHTKSLGQVALGRHGNFFHWGYSGGPKHMTEQGKKVFLNSLHYIAKFKGQKPLSKKIMGPMWLRSRVMDNENKDYNKAYENTVAFYNKINAESAENKIEAIAKKKKGLELTDQEKYFLNSKPSPIPTIEEEMAKRESVLYPKFGLDFKKYNQYYKEHLPYMRANPDNPWNQFIIDEDSKNFGISFYDVEHFLPACIEALGDDSKKDLALTLLKRYTLETFDTYKEWKKWYKKNKKRLFFTETGGCKYMINIYK